MADQYVAILTDGMDYQVEPLKVDPDKTDMLAFAEKTIGCSCVELVRPVGLNGDYAFFVDDNGHANGRSVNFFASALYSPDEIDGAAIVGKAVVVKYYDDGTADWLDEQDIEIIRKLAKDAADQQMRAFRELLASGGIQSRPVE